jgi:serine/threonine protein kinase
MDRRQEYLDNAIREHKIHQFCSHPNIVKTFGSLHDCSHIYLLMEFMEGETLGMELKHQVLKSMS